jgi:hypothetical protein
MPARRIVVATALTASLGLLAACGQGQPQNAVSAAPPASAALSAAPISGAPVSAAPAAATGDADSAHAFLAALYAKYAAESDSGPDIPAAEEFDPSLAAMMALDDKRGREGYESALDYDPVCDCQDPSEMKAAIVIGGATAEVATAAVTLSWPGPPPPDGPTKLTLDLVKVNGQWRIHDIHAHDTPSLRALLQKASKSTLRDN